jgi:hypothetical protein
MSTTTQIFVDILSVTSAIFFITLIVTLGFVIAILRQVKRLTARAENVASTVEAAASSFEKAASPIAVLKLVSSIVTGAAKFKKKG